MKKHTYVEIVTIGDEILYGQITDTNSQWIGQELNKLGFKVIRKTSIGDTKEEILTILDEAQKRADIILITGGLGPTKDDITKKTIAEYFNVGMTFRQEVFDNIAELFKTRNRALTDLNRLQAEVPENGEVIMNPVGTAPGMWFEQGNKTFVSMPGVPYEMKRLMSDSILEKLQKKYDTPFIVHKMLRTMGIPESLLADQIEEWENALPEFIGLAYLPRFGQVRLRLTAVGDNKEILDNAIDEQIEKLRPLLGDNLFAEEDVEIEQMIMNKMIEKELTLATAESCTGGAVAKRITTLSGCSAFYNGGIVSYSNEIKMTQLDVKGETLLEHGAVSEETALQMANNVRVKYNADFGIATTGIAGPGGGTKEKPVGTVWIALSTAEKTEAQLLQLTKTREVNISATGNKILKWLYDEI
ncbi:competence/damage-inducible protein A [Flammeovirga kamogawensis]|uniref:CinA-like protein n=1 Tax=Flammeovirga kamogawensis TaxID=373891 RepID=A0ABX8GVE0_9BACT|nr:competence/damage-inducible protein A [Flammeovirga kamogawensis]MBB6459660.1 nicotinamide-nucleotide amidase [Flammeovirga kamogawensis]QWG07277.1 competence/damage-inducible protein A [Flammeovirga kamogawensis]TRX69097.1 competence/damage-inducible protein A [Flammeovirga kamogawensis]